MSAKSETPDVKVKPCDCGPTASQAETLVVSSPERHGR